MDKMVNEYYKFIKNLCHKYESVCTDDKFAILFERDFEHYDKYHHSIIDGEGLTTVDKDIVEFKMEDVENEFKEFLKYLNKKYFHNSLRIKKIELLKFSPRTQFYYVRVTGGDDVGVFKQDEFVSYLVRKYNEYPRLKNRLDRIINGRT